MQLPTPQGSYPVCGKTAVAETYSGAPRCVDHRARHYLVLVGTSLTFTRREHDSPRDACLEVLERLGYPTKFSEWLGPEHRRQFDSRLASMRAEPADDALADAFAELVEQHVPANRRALIERGLST